MRDRWVFVDRDGTLIKNVPALADPRQVFLVKGAAQALKTLQSAGFKVAVVSNQAAVGRGQMTMESLIDVDLHMIMKLVHQGVLLDTYTRYCVHVPEEGCGCRKPKVGMFVDVLRHGDEAVAVIGDNACDIEAGKRLGVKTVLVRTGHGAEVERSGLCEPDHVVDSIADAALLLTKEENEDQGKRERAGADRGTVRAEGLPGRDQCGLSAVERSL